MEGKGLTEKQKRFADFYIQTGNATQSAILAGYKQKAAGAIGAENLKKPQIKEFIKKRLDEMDSKRVADAKEVMQFLTSVMRGEQKEHVTIQKVRKNKDGKPQPFGTSKVITSSSKINDRVRAAELLAKRFGLDIPTSSSEEPVQFVFNEDENEEG